MTGGAGKDMDNRCIAAKDVRDRRRRRRPRFRSLLLEQLDFRRRGRRNGFCGQRNVGVASHNLGGCRSPAQRVWSAGEDGLGRDEIGGDGLRGDNLARVRTRRFDSKRTILDTNIVEVDSHAVNGYGQFGPLAPLAVLFLSKHFASDIPARPVGSIQGAREGLEHIWRVYLKFSRHCESLGRRIGRVESSHDGAIALR